MVKQHRDGPGPSRESRLDWANHHHRAVGVPVTERTTEARNQARIRARVESGLSTVIRRRKGEPEARITRVKATGRYTTPEAETTAVLKRRADPKYIVRDDKGDIVDMSQAAAERLHRETFRTLANRKGVWSPPAHGLHRRETETRVDPDTGLPYTYTRSTRPVGGHGDGPSGAPIRRPRPEPREIVDDSGFGTTVGPVRISPQTMRGMVGNGGSK